MTPEQIRALPARLDAKLRSVIQEGGSLNLSLYTMPREDFEDARILGYGDILGSEGTRFIETVQIS